MIFHNLLGSILHHIITYTLIVTMTGTSSIPIIQQLPRATAAYLDMMQQLDLLKSDPTSPVGVSPVMPEEMKSLWRAKWNMLSASTALFTLMRTRHSLAS